jgi:hypothetical protein
MPRYLLLRVLKWGTYTQADVFQSLIAELILHYRILLHLYHCCNCHVYGWLWVWIGNCIDYSLYVVQSLVITINYFNSEWIFSRTLLPWLPRTQFSSTTLSVLGNSVFDTFHFLPTGVPVPLELFRLPNELSVKVKVMLRSTVSRPVCLGMKHISGAEDIFIAVRQLQVCWCEAQTCNCLTGQYRTFIA